MSAGIGPTVSSFKAWLAGALQGVQLASATRCLHECLSSVTGSTKKSGKPLAEGE